MLDAEVRADIPPPTNAPRKPAPAEAAATAQPADIQPEPGGLSGARGLTVAVIALLVASIVTVLVLRRRRR